GATYTATCAGAVDNAGNAAADVSVKYYVDSVPPAVTVTGVTEGAIYGLSTLPTADCATTDDFSGVKTPAILSTTNLGAAFTATCAGAVDNAGNAAASVSAQYFVDSVPPAVAVTGVTEGAIYSLSTLPTAGCATTDGLSGVQTPATLSLTNTGPAFTATCAGALDKVGNAAANVSVHYFVARASPAVIVSDVSEGAT